MPWAEPPSNSFSVQQTSEVDSRANGIDSTPAKTWLIGPVQANADGRQLLRETYGMALITVTRFGANRLKAQDGPPDRLLEEMALLWGFVDADGKGRDFADLPKRVVDLVDDPFRSLAGALRRRGGFAKDTTPFSEFLWADFLRRRLPRKLAARDFAKAVVQAMKLAKSEEASFLPGWCGPILRD